MEQCVRVRKAIAEDIVTSELRLLCPTSGALFLDETMDMDDEEQSQDIDVADKPRVLCTTQLGLMGYEKLGNEKGRGTVKKSVLIKAKVLLEDEADDVNR